jgi:hypothetical protein
LRIKLALGDREYVCGLAELMEMEIGELRAIKAETGLTPSQLQHKLVNFETDDDPDVFAALVYLLRSKSGEKNVSWAEVNSVPLSALSALDDEPPAAQVDEVPLGELVMVDG